MKTNCLFRERYRLRYRSNQRFNLQIIFKKHKEYALVGISILKEEGYWVQVMSVTVTQTFTKKTVRFHA